MSGCSMQKCMNFSPLTHIESGYAQYKAHLQLVFIPPSSSSHLDLTAFFSEVTPMGLTLEQISWRLVAMAAAGVSQRNTWHLSTRVFLSLAT